MLKLPAISIGASFIALGAFSTSSATAALLDFSFTTERGSTGSFILNTDTTPNLNPALGFNSDGSVIEIGFSYPDAVSNFSIITTDIDLSGVIADFGVFTAIPLDPPDSGVLSAVEFPSGCLTTTNFFCSIDVDLDYLGNISELPVLSDDPLSYSTNAVLRIADLTTGLVKEEAIIDLQVSDVQAKATPEPNSGFVTVAFGIAGIGVLVKRRITRTNAAARL